MWYKGIIVLHISENVTVGCDLTSCLYLNVRKHICQTQGPRSKHGKQRHLTWPVRASKLYDCLTPIHTRSVSRAFPEMHGNCSVHAKRVSSQRGPIGSRQSARFHDNTGSFTLIRRKQRNTTLLPILTVS